MDRLSDIDPSPLESAYAIQACLEYLQDEAARLGIVFGAHMIDVAAAAVGDWAAQKGGFDREVSAPRPAVRAATPLPENRGAVLKWRRRNS